MENNSWEYDYSKLYNTPNNPQQQPQMQAPQMPNINTMPVMDAMPQQPQHRKKRGVGKRIFAGFLSLVVFAGVGFGSGYAGGLLANKQNQPSTAAPVIVQTVENSTASTSTDTSLLTMSISDIIDNVDETVVAIDVAGPTMNTGIFGEVVGESGSGSGVVISSDGYIITNNHVIDGAQTINVKMQDGKEYPATLVGTDSVTDVAVVKIEATGLKAAVAGDSDVLRVGDVAIAIGNQLGTLAGTVSNGIISALEREVNVEGTDMVLLQTNAAVNPGSSGGGLFDKDGNLIGVVNAGVKEAEGIGFAIPVNTAIKVATELMENGAVTSRPKMGVMVLDLSSPEMAAQAGVSQLGVYIQSVTENSAAETAGLMAGDMIMAIDETLITTTTDLSNLLAKCEVGQVIKVQVVRENKLVTTDLTLDGGQ